MQMTLHLDVRKWTASQRPFTNRMRCDAIRYHTRYTYRKYENWTVWYWTREWEFEAINFISLLKIRIHLYAAWNNFGILWNNFRITRPFRWFYIHCSLFPFRLFFFGFFFFKFPPWCDVVWFGLVLDAHCSLLYRYVWPFGRVIIIIVHFREKKKNTNEPVNK